MYAEPEDNERNRAIVVNYREGVSIQALSELTGLTIQRIEQILMHFEAL
jgi:transposase